MFVLCFVAANNRQSDGANAARASISWGTGDRRQAAVPVTSPKGGRESDAATDMEPRRSCYELACFSELQLASGNSTAGQPCDFIQDPRFC